MDEEQPVEAGTPCEQGGPEHTPVQIHVKHGVRLEWKAWVCFANAHVRLWLRTPDGNEALIVDTDGESEVSKLIVGPPEVAALPNGEYRLRWRIETPSDKWQSRVEILSHEPPKMRYRRRRRSGDSQGVNSGSIAVRVA